MNWMLTTGASDDAGVLAGGTGVLVAVGVGVREGGGRDSARSPASSPHPPATASSAVIAMMTPATRGAVFIVGEFTTVDGYGSVRAGWASPLLRRHG